MTMKGLAIARAGGKVGQRIIRATAGPMANCVADCELAMRSMCGTHVSQQDSYVPPTPWSTDVARRGPGRPLRIGVLHSDQWFRPCTAIERGIREAAAALQDAGHEVVEFSVPDEASGWDVCRQYYGQLGSEGNMAGFVAALQGERLLGCYKRLKTMSDMPNVVRPLLARILDLLGHRRHASLLKVTRSGGLNVKQYWGLVGDHYALRNAYMNAMQDARLDALLLPAAAVAALPHGASTDLTPVLSYMFLANLLHWPAGVVPVTAVREDEQRYHDDAALPSDQRCMLAAKARQAMEGSVGLPIDLQIMTLPWQDELCLYAMAELERAVAASNVNGGAAEHAFVPPMAGL
eukprot:TRINITY_DN764_c0_g2_i1.p1 TRINITY_DN764_c0_g2~~TRINITY_DN764_c0_g2_i1.p1  ORF type:complete len:349 (-),score=121.04 TRINITY_DN764_c0_g2_i1:555-1601(-)